MQGWNASGYGAIGNRTSMRHARHDTPVRVIKLERPVSLTKHSPAHLATCLAVASTIVVACGRAPESRSDSSSAPGSVATFADTAALIRGTVASVSPTALVVKADTGSVTIHVTEPLQVYDRAAGSLSDVKDNSFVGVTSVKQPDGSERATEIHIFPDALRGLGEGSYMMAPSGGANRMTNGAVSSSRMTNGAASPSRMSNGTVAGANRSTITVQYGGGSQAIVVPANTPVTEIKPTSRALATGDMVVVPAKRRPDGSLTTSKAILARR